MNIKNLGLTKEQITINNENHKKAMEHFGLKHGDLLVLHHIDLELRHNDIDRYIQWNPEDLVVMTASEHTAFHRSLSREGRHNTPHTAEARKKMSESLSKHPVLCVETGQVFMNQVEAARETGASQSSISACLRGKKETSGGYHWKYYKQETN